MTKTKAGDRDAANDEQLIGTVLNERYRLDDVVARGGMGTIFVGTQLGLERRIAVKMVHAHLVADSDTRKRFEREAAAMTRFNHPDCVMIFDYGTHGARPFIVMEWVAGRPLSEILSTSHPLPLHRIARLVGGVCDVLSAAHTAGLVHRDLKPENIIVIDDPSGERIKLIDFGLAITAGPRPQDRVTGQGGTMGTPYYMSPEQCRGKPVDGRSDIYALGVILYELLVGEPPFLGETPMDIFMMHILNDPPLPSSRPNERPVPPAFDQVTLLALEKHPNARPQTALELRRAVEKALLTTQALPTEARAGGALSDVGRVERQRAMGIQTVEQSTSDEVLVESIPIVEPDPESTASLATLLRFLGFSTTALASLDEPHALSGVALVYDIRAAPDSALDEIEARFQGGSLSPQGLIVVGPDGPFSLIERALEIGIEDYVPASRTARALPKAIRRQLRRSRRREDPR